MASQSPNSGGVPETIERLGSKASSVRRSAAKRLGKTRSPEACPALLAAMEKELLDKRTWETQHAMIAALGECGCRDALPFLRRLMQQDFAATAVYSAIGYALVLLSAVDGTGIPTVLELLESNNVNLMEGALHGMARRKLKATGEEVRRIIAFAVDLPEFSPAGPGFFLKVWIAAAAAGWEASLVRDFLLDCSKSSESRLRVTAQASLEGRYVADRLL